MTERTTGTGQSTREGVNGSAPTGASAGRDWSRIKKDDAPRGVFRHPSGVWGIRFTCGAGHIHKERVGPLKSDAGRTYHARRARAHDQPGWCPEAERQAARARRQEAEARAARRLTFREYVTEYGTWAAGVKRGWQKNERYTAARLAQALGDRPLDGITLADIEAALGSLLEGRAAGTRNRYRDLCSAMFHRAVRLGLVPANPVKGVPKLREAGGRLVYLGPDEEAALLGALPARLRPAFTVAVNTGLRFSEQAALRWLDIDVLANSITVPLSKHGRPRALPMNSTVQAALVDLASRRERPDDPQERLFTLSYRQTAILFAEAVERAKAALQADGKPWTRLEGFTWHGLRHTFASRLVMAGVDLRTVQELGGWKTPAMVARYAHLSPGHLQAAVERLVPATPPRQGAAELSRKYPDRIDGRTVERGRDTLTARHA